MSLGTTNTYYISSLPSLGTLKDINGQEIKTVPYKLTSNNILYDSPYIETPTKNTSFSYYLNDGNNNSNTGTINITINFKQAITVPQTIGAAYQWDRIGTLIGYVPPLYFSKNGSMNAKFRVVFKKDNVYSSPGSIILTIIAGFEKPQIYYQFANNITTADNEKLVLQRADNSSNYTYWYDVQKVSLNNENSFIFGETEVAI
jgi:hypothetical protein